LNLDDLLSITLSFSALLKYVSISLDLFSFVGSEMREKGSKKRKNNIYDKENNP